MRMITRNFSLSSYRYSISNEIHHSTVHLKPGFHITVRCLRLSATAFCHLPSAICHLPSAICHLRLRQADVGSPRQSTSICDYLPAVPGNHRNNWEKVERVQLSAGRTVCRQNCLPAVTVASR